ncbi:MAG: GNAT family N-acetyltransferase [Candidatus Ornithospirochaeta sp.]
MEYEKTFGLKDGRTLIVRNGRKEDAESVLSCFISTHGETDFLLTYPEECHFTVEDEGKYLESQRTAERSIELLAMVDGSVVGTAGIGPKGRGMKVSHRSDFGISISRDYWGLGIGRILTNAAIECAEKASYRQVELEVVEENTRARSLYSSMGFHECGKIPAGFITKEGKVQDLVMMVKTL